MECRRYKGFLYALACDTCMSQKRKKNTYNIILDLLLWRENKSSHLWSLRLKWHQRFSVKEVPLLRRTLPLRVCSSRKINWMDDDNSIFFFRSGATDLQLNCDGVSQAHITRHSRRFKAKESRRPLERHCHLSCSDHECMKYLSLK